jgi:hypothetical protein
MTAHEYWQARDRAEQKAKTLAVACVEEFRSEPIRKVVKGQQFVAVGGCDKEGSWHFAVDFETPADREDVNAWLCRPI